MLEVIGKKKAHLTLLQDMKGLRRGMSNGKELADGALERMSRHSRAFLI